MPQAPDRKDKPLILCDVSGVLLLSKEFGKPEVPNPEMIAVLNRAWDMGFNICICTSGVDNGDWSRDKDKLREAKLNPAILESVSGKKRIAPDTFSSVVAIIDDWERESYIPKVKESNPQAPLFSGQWPDSILRHLQTVKPKGAQIGVP